MCYLRPWLTRFLQYIMSFCFVDDVMFSHNGAGGPESKMALCFVEYARCLHGGWSCCIQLQTCTVLVWRQKEYLVMGELCFIRDSWQSLVQYLNQISVLFIFICCCGFLCCVFTHVAIDSSVVRLSVCVSVCWSRSWALQNMAEPIEMPFGVWLVWIQGTMC